jgi:uncharacterized membrane protein YedE/YeeE
MNLQENKVFKKIVKDSWPYLTGAVLLGILNTAFLMLSKTPWGVTTPFSYWGGWILRSVGIPIEKWAYFAGPHKAALDLNFFTHGGSLVNLGVIFGALLASLAASQFKIKKIKSVSQVVGAVSGGLLMGYGARIAFGCNIGALFSGIASSSLHGWVYLVFMFAGVWIGSKLLVKFFM